MVYKIDPSGQETVLYTFTGGADGGLPDGLVLDSAGNLYGTAWYGANGGGIVFEISKAGKESALYSFTSGGRWGISG